MTWRPVNDDELKPLENELLWEHLAEKAANADGQTMLYCRYISKTYYQNGGWVNIDEDTYLENAHTFERIDLTHAIGIPLSPHRHFFKNGGELKQFVLLFPPIPKFWKTFHLVERAGAGSFRVRDIERNNSGIYHIQLT
jgi:hypothetical protein